MSIRRVFYSLPPSWRFLARRLWYAPSDFVAQWSDNKSDLIPPKGMIFTGSGDFEKDGRELLHNFEKYAGLLPKHHVLDIGSGIGRVAVPLTQFLDKNARYEGFDVVEKGVEWCTERISSRYPNFRFRYIPLKNDLYTEKGEDATQFSFPYPDASFDFACSISVFTHMLPDEVSRYFDEIYRVLKPGGTVFCTFFILSDKARTDSNPDFTFPHLFEHHALMDKKVQAGNVAFEEKWLLENAVQTKRFDLLHQFDGFWSGKSKEQCLNFQDVLVLRKQKTS